jgi:hypothetical protein
VEPGFFSRVVLGVMTQQARPPRDEGLMARNMYY